ncbi:MAG: hypothetical protein L6R40_003566 [Gallowayella cf. fulva]|nr:MAG: hypothetical protein L6R40_003566 [Xanthomendoza cf. fulva]
MLLRALLINFLILTVTSAVIPVSLSIPHRVEALCYDSRYASRHPAPLDCLTIITSHISTAPNVAKTIRTFSRRPTATQLQLPHTWETKRKECMVTIDTPMSIPEKAEASLWEIKEAALEVLGKSQTWPHQSQFGNIHDDQVARLAARPLHPLALTDLVRHGRPPLSTEALFSSANFTLSLLPIRLAHRIQALRNLPFIVVSNPHIAQIYSNYIHSFSTLLPYQERRITNLEDEIQFTEVMADLVQTHSNTIPTLARGFLECRKYISPGDVTHFLDEHLRARVGTRLMAEQHIALHLSSTPHNGGEHDQSSYIGVIDTALRPAEIVRHCEAFVGEICELKYGVRPTVVIDGQVDARMTHVPTHLEYIITELLKNAFRATVESGKEREPIEVTIAVTPNVPESSETAVDEPRLSLSSSSGVTIRIRDRGGGISPDVLPSIWAYSFTTFADEDIMGMNKSGNHGKVDALNAISGSNGDSSSLAGLGYGLPLGRAYAEHFGGGVQVQSLWAWGTDVYLNLKGLGDSK